jgi:hypothetical protein
LLQITKEDTTIDEQCIDLSILVVNGSIFTFEEKIEENAFCILS